MTVVRLNPPMPYPTNALHDVKLLVEIVRNNEVAARRVEFAHAGWIVQGFIQGIIVGDPTEHQLARGSLTVGIPTQVRSDTEALDLLETLSDNANQQAKQQRAIRIPPEIWRGLYDWIEGKIREALFGVKRVK